MHPLRTRLEIIHRRLSKRGGFTTDQGTHWHRPLSALPAAVVLAAHGAALPATAWSCAHCRQARGGRVPCCHFLPVRTAVPKGLALFWSRDRAGRGEFTLPSGSDSWGQLDPALPVRVTAAAPGPARTAEPLLRHLPRYELAVHRPQSAEQLADLRALAERLQGGAAGRRVLLRLLVGGHVAQSHRGRRVCQGHPGPGGGQHSATRCYPPAAGPTLRPPTRLRSAAAAKRARERAAQREEGACANGPPAREGGASALR
jgi:hypothetical protein